NPESATTSAPKPTWTPKPPPPPPAAPDKITTVRPAAKKLLALFPGAETSASAKVTALHSKAAWDKMPADQRHVAREYTGGLYNSINNALRHPDTATPNDTKNV